MRCADRLHVPGGNDVACGLPQGHEGNHRGTSPYDSRYVYWTPVDQQAPVESNPQGDDR